MQYIQQPAQFQNDTDTIVTLGKFDGIHLGHRKLLREVRRQAEESRLAGVPLQTAVFTFSVSPQTALGQRKAAVLMTAEERCEALRDMGLDLLAECPFTPEIRNMDPETFVREMLVRRLCMKRAVVGTDFRFGRNRAGDPAVLAALGEQYGFRVTVMEKETDGIREISSTYVREELTAGNIPKVTALLGRPYSITAEIVHGRHLGHTLGFPTINQVPPAAKLLPPNGVYYSRTYVGGKWYQGISNIGTKPTVSGSGDAVTGVETYLFDCDLDLYGQIALVELLAFRRPEQKFDSLSDLQEQMSLDIRAADQFFTE